MTSHIDQSSDARRFLAAQPPQALSPKLSPIVAAMSSQIPNGITKRTGSPLQPSRPARFRRRTQADACSPSVIMLSDDESDPIVSESNRNGSISSFFNPTTSDTLVELSSSTVHHQVAQGLGALDRAHVQAAPPPPGARHHFEVALIYCKLAMGLDTSDKQKTDQLKAIWNTWDESQKGRLIQQCKTKLGQTSNSQTIQQLVQLAHADSDSISTTQRRSTPANGDNDQQRVIHPVKSLVSRTTQNDQQLNEMRATPSPEAIHAADLQVSTPLFVTPKGPSSAVTPRGPRAALDTILSSPIGGSPIGLGISSGASPSPDGHRAAADRQSGSPATEILPRENHLTWNTSDSQISSNACHRPRRTPPADHLEERGADLAKPYSVSWQQLKTKDRGPRRAMSNEGIAAGTLTRAREPPIEIAEDPKSTNATKRRSVGDKLESWTAKNHSNNGVNLQKPRGFKLLEILNRTAENAPNKRKPANGVAQQRQMSVVGNSMYKVSKARQPYVNEQTGLPMTTEEKKIENRRRDAIRRREKKERERKAKAEMEAQLAEARALLNAAPVSAIERIENDEAITSRSEPACLPTGRKMTVAAVDTLIDMQKAKMQGPAPSADVDEWYMMSGGLNPSVTSPDGGRPSVALIEELKTRSGREVENADASDARDAGCGTTATGSVRRSSFSEKAFSHEASETIDRHGTAGGTLAEASQKPETSDSPNDKGNEVSRAGEAGPIAAPEEAIVVKDASSSLARKPRLPLPYWARPAYLDDLLVTEKPIHQRRTLSVSPTASTQQSSSQFTLPIRVSPRLAQSPSLPSTSQPQPVSRLESVHEERDTPSVTGAQHPSHAGQPPGYESSDDGDFMSDEDETEEQELSRRALEADKRREAKRAHYLEQRGQQRPSGAPLGKSQGETVNGRFDSKTLTGSYPSETVVGSSQSGTLVGTSQSDRPIFDSQSSLDDPSSVLQAHAAVSPSRKPSRRVPAQKSSRAPNTQPVLKPDGSRVTYYEYHVFCSVSRGEKFIREEPLIHCGFYLDLESAGLGAMQQLRKQLLHRVRDPTYLMDDLENFEVSRAADNSLRCSWVGINDETIVTFVEKFLKHSSEDPRPVDQQQGHRPWLPSTTYCVFDRILPLSAPWSEPEMGSRASDGTLLNVFSTLESANHFISTHVRELVSKASPSGRIPRADQIAVLDFLQHVREARQEADEADTGMDLTFELSGFGSGGSEEVGRRVWVEPRDFLGPRN
ncbi:MAG: hypothetical protein M1817_004634 [Caeruleum heppii]|nr:MAG: hypothetical protein M1817_004634 [Caeruleum heppii]